MSRRSSIQEKPKSLIYFMSGNNAYNVATENLNDFYEQFKNNQSIWYLKNMFYLDNLTKKTDSLVYYWSLQFPNIQIVYSYGSIYTYNYHSYEQTSSLVRDRTNGLIFRRPDSITEKSNLELRIYKRKHRNVPLKAYFLEWILPNDQQFNPDYFITDYHYYLQAIQWLFNNLGLEPIVPSEDNIKNDKYIKFKKDTYTYNKQPILFLEDLHKNNPQYIELNQKLDELFIDKSTVKLHPNFQQIPRPQQNGGKKKPTRKVK